MTTNKSNLMKTNEELRKDVVEEIKWDPELRDIATEIGVAAKDGVITLSGVVSSYRKKLAAEKAAQRVSGVKVVACDTDVALASIGKRTDTEVAQTIQNVLRWNSAVNDDKIEIKVDNGWVYLDGKVDFPYEKKNAQEAVEDIVGVRNVTNRIIVNVGPIDTKEIQRQIAAAYHRNATVDSSAIQVETSGSKITLRGKVKSWIEKKEAEDIAWRAHGVLAVENNIDIDNAVFV